MRTVAFRWSLVLGLLTFTVAGWPAVAAVCPNGVCEALEEGASAYCAADCCGNGFCSDFEDGSDACPIDCAVCDDGVCEGNETRATCPGDCAVCDDGFCDGTEVGSCPADCCGDGICHGIEEGGGKYCFADCCGNGSCSDFEDGGGCPDDCAVCGDDVCEGNETRATCPDDCAVCDDGFCDGTEVGSCPADCCGDGICHGIEEGGGKYCFADCCGNGSCSDFEDGGGCPADCSADCGNGSCDAPEDHANCPADCAVCGDGFCDGSEFATCAADCCGDGTCEGNEQGGAYCAADCCGDGSCSTFEEENAACPADCAECQSDTDCEDGLFCTRDQCQDGACTVVSACSPTIDGCIERNASCDEEHDTCVDARLPLCNDVCRSAGYFGAHGGCENGAPNVTKAVLESCGGCALVCGERLSASALTCPAGPANGKRGPIVGVDDADSPTEAVCIATKTDPRLQLARQLAALALNCCASGFGRDCAGDPALATLFSSCDATCLAQNVDETAACVFALDCYNSGGTVLAGDRPFCQTGTCTNGAPCNEATPCVDASECRPLAGNCHDEPLCIASTCYGDDVPASSSGACKEAKKAVGGTKREPAHCLILPPDEGNCDDGTIALVESCGP